MEKEFVLSTLIHQQAEKYGDRAAIFGRNDETGLWEGISWREMDKTVEALAAGIIGLGVKSNDRVGIFSQNMCEIIMADYANYSAHAITVPLYATSTAAQVDFIVDDSEIGVIYAGEQYQYDVALEVMKKSKFLRTIVAIDPSIDLKGEKNAIRYSDLLADGLKNPRTEEIAARKALASDDDLVNILYTSGTTGNPKGVELRHYNYAEAMRIHNIRLTSASDKDTSMAFLPITHVFERAWDMFCLQKGIQIYVNKRPAEIAKIMPEVRPSLMCAVPRYWEKVYAAVNDKINGSPKLLKSIFKWAIKVGRRRNLDYYRNGKHSPLNIGLAYKFIAAPLFKKVKKAAGLDNGNFFPVAGARLADEILEFMHAIGINLVYGYGLTESTATVCCFPLNNRGYIIGSIGQIMPDLQVKISSEGEILLKGKTITSGYYKRPDANAESYTEDGFFKTGDAGYIDMQNNLYITDRIKDLFKTAGGKYIAPQHLEGLFSDSSYVDQCVAIGNERKYVTMLIVPNFENLTKYATSKGLTFASKEELIALPEVVALYDGIIIEKNEGLARYEQIKRFTLLPNAFTMDQGHLTNTLKIKRKVVNELFAKEIDAMYE